MHEDDKKTAVFLGKTAVFLFFGSKFEITKYKSKGK